MGLFSEWCNPAKETSPGAGKRAEATLAINGFIETMSGSTRIDCSSTVIVCEV